MSRKGKRGRKKKKDKSLELIGLLLIFLAILVIGEFGFVGQFIANITKVFVGQTFQFFAVLLGVLGSYYIFKGKQPKLTGHRFAGILILYLTSLIWLHLRMFKPIMEADVNILSATWRNVRSLFNQPMFVQDIGGGMIGALLYAASYFLFANIGTYVLIILLTFVSVMSIGDFSYKKLFDKMTRFVKQ